jgi:protein TonB
MNESFFLTGTRPPWIGCALLLHLALLLPWVFWPHTSVEMPTIAPIEVRLVGPEAAVMPSSAPAPPAPEPEPVKPAVKPNKPAVAPQRPPLPVPPSPSIMTEPLPELASGSEAATEQNPAETQGGAQTEGAPSETQAKAGGAWTEARFDADYLRNPHPPYPPLSRRLREEGRVMLRAYVLSDGQAGRVEIKKSSGFPRLDEAARAAVERWRFVPARRGNESVPAWVLIPISFRLES